MSLTLTKYQNELIWLKDKSDCCGASAANVLCAANASNNCKSLLWNTNYCNYHHHILFTPWLMFDVLNRRKQSKKKHRPQQKALHLINIKHSLSETKRICIFHLCLDFVRMIQVKFGPETLIQIWMCMKKMSE